MGPEVRITEETNRIEKNQQEEEKGRKPQRKQQRQQKRRSGKKEKKKLVRTHFPQCTSGFVLYCRCDMIWHDIVLCSLILFSHHESGGGGGGCHWSRQMSDKWCHVGVDDFTSPGDALVCYDVRVTVGSWLANASCLCHLICQGEFLILRQNGLFPCQSGGILWTSSFIGRHEDDSHVWRRNQGECFCF